MMKRYKPYIYVIISVFIAIVLLFQLVLFRVVVDGDSMYPTLKDRELGISLRTLIAHKIQRFDIVIIRLDKTDEYIIKRVVGLPGDTVAIDKDGLYINGAKVREPFLETTYRQEYIEKTKQPFTFKLSPVKLGLDEYYVLGDNRPLSNDSRFLGPIKKNSIVAIGYYQLNGKK